MNEVRDNVKLALPFLAGSLSYACLSSDISYAYSAAGTSMLMLTTFMLLNLWRIRKNGFTRPWNMVFPCLMGFSAGFCIHAVCELTDLTRDPTSGGFFEQVGNTMQGWIDGMEFRSRNTNAIIKALLTGNHCHFPIIDGELVAGGAQDIWFCEYDGPSQRTVSIIIEGE